jgi:predicted nucleic acid-binding protein
MGMVSKVTFTLDAETVHKIGDAAERLAKPKSQVVREAVADYHSRMGRLSEKERRRMLRVFDTLVPRIPLPAAAGSRSGTARTPARAAHDRTPAGLREPPVIVLDTSVLIDGLTGPKRSGAAIRAAIVEGERILLPALVLYEWLRGPRLRAELAAQDALFPSAAAIPFGPEEAAASASLYRTIGRARKREIDLAIAACAIVRDAPLWTLNPADFQDVPRLRLYIPAAQPS